MDNLVSRREFSSELVVAPRPVAIIATENIARIDRALIKLMECGVRVEAHSRLHQARDVLVAAAQGLGITPLQRGDDLGLRALETALDYHTIASATRPQMPASVRRELRDSLRGSLSPPPNAFSALQLQSQAVGFAVFALAGCEPHHPAKVQGQSPDILLDRYMSTYAVELKRPQVRGNIIANCHVGYDQLVASGHTGAVLIDVTDCVRGLVADDVHAFVEETGLQLLESVATEKGRRREFRSLITVGCYARVQAVVAESDADAVFDLITTCRIAVLANVRNSLEDHRARWIRDSHETGMKAVYDPILTPSPDRVI